MALGSRIVLHIAVTARKSNSTEIHLKITLLPSQPKPHNGQGRAGNCILKQGGRGKASHHEEVKGKTKAGWTLQNTMIPQKIRTPYLLQYAETEAGIQTTT
jgi:hypothetical protein